MTKSCSDRLYDIVNSVLKVADCDSATYFAKKITRAHGWITFCLFKGKINNNTNIYLDLRQIGCYCIRFTASYNNTANIVVGLDKYLLNTDVITTIMFILRAEGSFAVCILSISARAKHGPV